MAKKTSRKKARKRMLFLGTMSIGIILFTASMIGTNLIEIYHKYQEKKTLEQEYLALQEEEEKLKVDADKLQDPDYIARYAREKYMYSKDGEFILRIP